MLGKAVGRRLVDVDETLLAFHPQRSNASAGYRSAMSIAQKEDWLAEGPGRLPWWRIGRPPDSDAESEIAIDKKRTRIQMDGLSNVQVRPRMEVDRFLETGAAACKETVEDLRSRKRRATIVEAREILAWLGVELYGFTVKEMAVGLEKYLETTSRLVSRAALRRTVEKDIAERIRQVDSAIATAWE